MSLITRMRRQKAVWWKRGTTPDQYGAFTFNEPVEIECRWDDQGQEYRNSQNEVAVSNAVVYPDRVLSVGDRLRKNELSGDIPDDPMSIQDSFAVERFDETPNLKNTETLYTAYL